MEANLKLLKKKRIAHFGNKMAKINFDEPKLPPDDFVYNIIKDMDSSKNVISYQQLEEFRSKKRQSKNKEEKPSNSSMPDNYNNQAKKILPKKSFPLMKKCQTSLKYLEKNRCIPKPRAHVGFVPKPPVKPISHAEQSTSKLECQNKSKVKSKKIQSKAYSKILQTNFKINNDFQRKSCESKDFTAQEVEISDHLSSSEDDNAFENFVQKVNQEVADSSDSDSRLIIRRKKSRKSSKQESKKLKINSLSSNVNNRHVAKITSIPLSDSSECEETFEVNRPKGKCVSIKTIGSAKRYADSPERFQKRVCKDGIESYNSESLSEDASGTFNYDSSDDEPNVETSSVNSVDSTNEKVTVCAVNCDSADNEFYVGTSSVNSFRALIEKEKTVCTANVDLQYNSNTITLNDLPLNKVQSNSVADETNALKHELIPCFVRLQRDPTLDEKTSTLCSIFPPTSNTGNCFEDDCIVISDDSDSNEVSTSHSIPSHVTNKSCESLDLSLNTQNLCTEVLESHTDSSSIQGKKDESDDCVFMFEMPKVSLSNQIKESNSISNSLSSKSLIHIPMSNSTASLSSDVESPNEVKSVTPVIESLNLPILNTKTNNECALVLENSRSNTDVKIAELNSNSSNSGTTDSGSYCHANASETFGIPELNVKIVTVVSLGESSNDPPVIEAKDLNGIEVIDLLDDDSKPLEENKSSEDEKVLDVVDPFNTSDQVRTIQCNNTGKVTENTVVSFNSTTGNNEQSSCENHPADIEQIYHTINFDHLKAAIDTVYSKSKSSNVVENSELPHLSSPMTICGLDREREKVSSDIIILEDEALQKTNSSSFSAENSAICNATQENKVPVTSIPNSKDPLHKSDSGGNVPLNTFLTEPAQNMIQQGSSQDAAPLLITIDDIEKGVSFADVNLKLEHIDDSNNRSNRFNIHEIVKQEIPHAKGRKRSHSHIQEMKHPILENPLDALDAVTTSLVYALKDENQRFQSLISLYQKELTKYAQIKSTEINVSAGLKLLHEEQERKVAHLRFALEHLLATQRNAADIKNESVNKVEVNKSKSLEKNELEVSKSENLNTVQINKNERVNKDANKIESVFKLNKNETVNKEANKIENMDKVKVNKNNTMNKIKVEDTTPILPKISAKTSVKFNSAGKSKEELLKMIRRYKCSHCQKPATAACQGCNEAYFCSPECGERSWEKGHKSICKR